MFLWNMVGALALIPALSHFLLRDPRQRPAGGPSAHEPILKTSQCLPERDDAASKAARHWPRVSPARSRGATAPRHVRVIAPRPSLAAEAR